MQWYIYLPVFVYTSSEMCRISQILQSDPISPDKDNKLHFLHRNFHVLFAESEDYVQRYFNLLNLNA